MTTETVKSPCISVCVLDGDDICEGCYRSAQEITDWSVLSDDDRRRVLEKVKQRFQQRSKHSLL